MARLDVTKDLISRVQAYTKERSITARVSSSISEVARKGISHIVITRDGGGMQNPLVDRVEISTYVFSDKEQNAAELAYTLSELYRSLGAHEGYARVDEISMRSEFDMRLARPRWYLSHTFYCTLTNN